MDNDKKLAYLRGLEKLKASKIKSDDYTSPLESDVMRVKGGAAEPELVTKIKGMTQKIDTRSGAPVISGEEFRNKIEALRAAKAGGKKMLAALPFVGAGMAALSGDPAMAAEELAMDLPGAEALRSESVGESAEDEALMLSEDKARKAYGKSPARLAKLRALMGRGND